MLSKTEGEVVVDWDNNFKAWFLFPSFGFKATMQKSIRR